MKLIYYPPAFLLSRWYAFSLKRKCARAPSPLNGPRVNSLLKAVKKQLYSPQRNDPTDLVKNLIAAYFISSGDTVIDAGAHLGRFTAYYASLVGEEGKVHSYEAHPQIFENLKDRFLKAPQVTVHHFAVSNQSEHTLKMKIYPDALDKECATVEESLMNLERMPGNTALISVPCQALDTHLTDSSIKRCSFIKIDVEGHEGAVIEGAKKLIQKYRPILVYEYGYEPGKFEPQTIEQLAHLNYISYDCKSLHVVSPRHIALTPTDLAAIPYELDREFKQLISILK